MAAAVITASASILVAVLALILNQHAQIRQEYRQARLSRVSSQLQELYGPLNTLVDVNERIWQVLRQSRLPPQAERRSESSTEEWRRWRDHALMPANRRMRDLIFDHANLLVETDVPQPLRDFCAHALVPHPGAAYTSYVSRTYTYLKDEQQHLLATTKPLRYLTLRGGGVSDPRTSNIGG